MAALWLEVDEDGTVLRRSDEVAAIFDAMEPPIQSLDRVLELRTDLRAAIGRRAGAARFGVGRGAERIVFDADVSAGAHGARLVLERTDPLADHHELGQLLIAHAERHTDSFLVTDPDGIILWCDRGFCRLVGYERTEIVGRHKRLYRSARVSPREVESYWRSLFACGSYTGEWVLRRSDGVDLPVSQSVSAVVDAAGRTTHYVGVFRDVSREREIARIRAVDLAVNLLGRLSGDHAHALNDVAAEISAVCESAMLSDDPASAGTALERVASLAASLGDLGRRMLALSTAGTAGAGPADLGRVARDLASVLEAASGDGGRVVVTVPEGGPWVRCAPDALVRASIHLALRALDGVTGEHPLEIVVSQEYEEGVLRMRYRPSPGERELLRWLLPGGGVTGPISNELLTRAFGAGVGLDLEEGRDGQVAVCVRAELAEAVPGHGHGPPPSTEARWSRLCVVEDNEALRELVATAMLPLFDEVVQAGDGAEALALLERLEGRVDLLVLDLRLPTIDGLAVLEQVRRKWPSIPAIVASGAAPEGLVQTAMAAGARAVLQKPFKLAALRAVARGVMEGAEW